MRVGGCGSQETTDHLFLGCATLGRVWHLVWQWLQLTSVSPLSLNDHFLQFSHMVAMPQSSRSFFKIIWLACMCLCYLDGEEQPGVQ